MKHSRSLLLSSTFAIPAQDAPTPAPVAKQKPYSPDLLKKEMQNRFHIVMERLLETHYDLKTTADDPDIIFEAEDSSGATFVTVIAPMLSRREGGKKRAPFLDKINSFIRDILPFIKHKAIHTKIINNQYCVEYYPPHMAMALANFADKHKSQDPKVKNNIARLSVLCARYQGGEYVPAHKLH